MTGVDSGRRDPWRPVPAGRGVGKRFAQPTDHPDPCRRDPVPAGCTCRPSRADGGLRRITRRSDDHDQHADCGGHTRPQRSAINHWATKHRPGEHGPAEHGGSERGVGRPWTSRHGAGRAAPDAALGARSGAEPAAHRQAGPGGGRGGNRRGYPLHRRAPGRAARGGRDRGGAGRAWNGGAATSSPFGLGVAAAGSRRPSRSGRRSSRRARPSAPRRRRDYRGRRPHERRTTCCVTRVRS